MLLGNVDELVGRVGSLRCMSVGPSSNGLSLATRPRASQNDCYASHAASVVVTAPPASRKACQSSHAVEERSRGATVPTRKRGDLRHL